MTTFFIVLLYIIVIIQFIVLGGVIGGVIKKTELNKEHLGEHCDDIEKQSKDIKEIRKQSMKAYKQLFEVVDTLAQKSGYTIVLVDKKKTKNITAEEIMKSAPDHLKDLASKARINIPDIEIETTESALELQKLTNRKK
jgi:hypothetical protein